MPPRTTCWPGRCSATARGPRRTPPVRSLRHRGRCQPERCRCRWSADGHHGRGAGPAPAAARPGAGPRRLTRAGPAPLGMPARRRDDPRRCRRAADRRPRTLLGRGRARRHRLVRTLRRGGDHPTADPRRRRPMARRGPGRLTELPLSLAVAAWLLGLEAQVRQIPRLAAFGVPASMQVGEAAATGRALAGAVRARLHAGLLVMGDLSARRTLKAPASFHPAAEEFDRQVGDAIRKAEIGRVLDADAGLADELRVGAMAVLWLLAGALEDAGDLRTEVLNEAAPFGVGYLVGVIESR